MRKTLAVLIILGTVTAAAQTVLINPDAEGGFENGPSLEANGWISSNDNINKWVVGTGKVMHVQAGVTVGPEAGSWAFISDNDGISHSYAGSVPQASHFYRDIQFPAGEMLIVLDFVVSSGIDAFQYEGVVKVFVIPIESAPLPGIKLAGTGQVGDTEGYTGYRNAGMFYRIILPSSLAGTTKRLVFSWENNNGGNWPDWPPAAINNISLTSQGGITSNGTGGGPWSSGSTWTGGVVPTTGDNVLIRDGDQIAIDADANANKVAVGEGISGLIEFDPAADRRLTVAKDVVVSNGATFRTGATGTANHEVAVGESFFANGTVDFSTNGNATGANIEFNGSGQTQIFGGTGSTIDIRSIDVNMLNVTSSARVVEITVDNLSVQGATSSAPGFVTLTKGGIKISGSAPLETVLFTTASPTIATTSAVWLNNPNLVVTPQNGSLTVQGTLRVAAGALNVGEDEDDCIILAPFSSVTVDGGAIGVTGPMGVASLSQIISFRQNGGSIVVQKAGNSSTIFAGLSLGNSSTVSVTGGEIIVQQPNSALSGPGDIAFPLIANITGGSLQLGNVTTTASAIWRIRGGTPTVVVDQTHDHTVQLTASTRFNSSTTIPAGATLDLNGWGLEAKGDLIIDGTLDAGGAAVGNGGSITFSGSAPQSFAGSGVIVDDIIDVITINNGSGTVSTALDISHDITIGEALNVNGGSVGGGGQITLGNSAASTTFTLRRAGDGILEDPPAFNLGGVTYNVTYNFSSQSISAGVELPSTINGTLLINNSNGVLLNATTSVTALSLTNGVLTVPTSSSLIIASTATGNITGGSSTSFVRGDLIRTFPDILAAGSEYSFPVGKNTYNPVIIVDAVRNATTTATVLARVVEENVAVTPGSGIGEIDMTPLWTVGPTDPLDILFEELRIRFPNRSDVGGGSRIGKSDAADGTFNSIGGTVSGNSITSDVIGSFSYFAIGVTDNTISGSYTVGASGADYPTISAAIDTISGKRLTGPVMLSLLDASYPSETFPITIPSLTGSSPANTLTIKPESSVSPSISGGSSSGVFKLDGADYVTIDGSNSGTSSRDFTINSTDPYSPVIWLSSSGPGAGATHNVIKNLNLAGGLSQVSTNVGAYGILASGTSPVLSSQGADNDSNTVQNNYITKARYGIWFLGASGNPNLGNSIIANVVGPAAFGVDQIGKTGICVGYESGITISGNEVRNVGAITGQLPGDFASEDRTGIGIGDDDWSPFATTVTNASVTGNSVHDIIDEYARSAVGILVAGSGSPSNNVIANNMIYNVRSNGTSGEQGVGMGVSTGSGDKIVFNSINLTGDVDPSTSTTATGSNAGIRVSSATNLTLKNNIISVDLTSNTGTLNHYAIVAPSFYSWGTGGLNYNDYFVNASNAQMKIGGIGFSVPYTAYADLTAWKTNFSGAQDANSKSVVPDFTSSTNLHLNVGSSNANYAGSPIAGVTTDYDGETRSGSFPYIGADEVPAFPLIAAPAAPSLALPADNAIGQATSVTPKWNPSVGATGYQFQISTSAGFETTLVNDSTLTDTTRLVSSLANNTEYFWRVRAYNSAGVSPFSVVFSFTTVSLAPAAPINLTATQGNQQVNLKWQKNMEPGIMRYRIFQGTSPAPTIAADSTNGVADTSKTITGLANGTTYHFRVTALDSSLLESPYSNEVSATPADVSAPSAPAGLMVTDSSNKTLTVAWQKNGEPDFLRYRIYRGISSNPSTAVDSTGGISDTSKTMTGLTNNTRYYVRVTAVDSAGNESAYSNEVNAVPADRVPPVAPQDLIAVDSSSTQIGIKWRRNAEADFLKYMIYRGTSPNPVTRVDSTSGGASDTSRMLTGLVNGTRYFFRVTAVDSAGNESPYSNEVNAAPNAPTGIEDILSQIPKEYSLSQNYPNPFNPSTVIRYGLPERSKVRLEIYDMLGRRVKVLADQEEDARYYEVFWDANVPSGTYFCRINAVAVANPERSFVQVRKMILLK